MYNHALDRPAKNFCTGGFGNAFGKEFICVQSMDGLLSFFEQATRPLRAYSEYLTVDDDRRSRHFRSFVVISCFLGRSFTIPRYCSSLYHSTL